MYSGFVKDPSHKQPYLCYPDKFLFILVGIYCTMRRETALKSGCRVTRKNHMKWLENGIKDKSDGHAVTV